MPVLSDLSYNYDHKTATFMCPYKSLLQILRNIYIYIYIFSVTKLIKQSTAHYRLQCFVTIINFILYLLELEYDFVNTCTTNKR